jgi:arylsulfatase A-like enzyme
MEVRHVKAAASALLLLSLASAEPASALPPGAAASSVAAAAAAGSAGRSPNAPALVVVVSLDGLSWQRLESYRPWYTSGLKRLLDEGRVETGARYQHLNTETAPGHASLATGAPPRVHGVVANRWIEAAPDGTLRSVGSAQQRQGVAPGEPPSNTARATITGPGNLRVPTLGDRLVEASPSSRVVVVSGKDRTSLFLAGRDARHAAYWYDAQSGRFVSSAAYDSQAPAGASVGAIVSRFNSTQAGSMLPVRFGTEWHRLPAPPERTGHGAAPLPQAVPGLWDFQLPSNGLGFPHDLRRSDRGYFHAFYVSPYVDELVADLALALVSDAALGLGRGGAPDLLGVGFSAQDTVSHSYGNESEENLDTIRRLDVQLGRLLDALERALERGSYVVAVSADHGFAPIPEAERIRAGAPRGGRLVNHTVETPWGTADRVYPTALERLNRYLREVLCLPEDSRPVFGGEGWSMAWDRPAFPMRTVAGRCGAADAPVALADFEREFPRAVEALFGEEIETVLLVSERERWPADLPAAEFARNDFDAQRSGDAFLVPRPGVLMHWDPGRGSHHGSHHDYDTRVPLIFWGGPFRPGIRDRPTTPYDLAPTLAELLGVTLPDATGRSLR